jgi:hypothetical protein
LRDFGHDPSVRFVYTYDLGDNWRHIVEIEEWLTLDDTPRFAACLDGARARPPEDAGGVSGYEAFLEIMSDTLDAEHTEMKRWCGGHFDPEWFDPGWVDRDVRNALRPTRAGGCTSPNQEAQAMDQRHRRPRRCPFVGCIGFDHPLDWPAKRPGNDRGDGPPTIPHVRARRDRRARPIGGPCRRSDARSKGNTTGPASSRGRAVVSRSPGSR